MPDRWQEPVCRFRRSPSQRPTIGIGGGSPSPLAERRLDGQLTADQADPRVPRSATENRRTLECLRALFSAS
jgi:hypothetical protein